MPLLGDREWRRWELVDGELEFMSPADSRHEEALGRLLTYLFSLCRAQPQWVCLASNVVYTMLSGNLRMPDTSLARREHFPSETPSNRSGHPVPAPPGAVPPREFDTWTGRCELTEAGLVHALVPPRELSTAKIDFPPDVAFEIRSPSDRSRQVEGKHKDYEESGVIQVWIDLERRLTEVIYPERPPQYFSESQIPLIHQPAGLSLDLRSLYLR